MRVAIQAPSPWRTPPEHDGPWEQVCGVPADAPEARAEFDLVRNHVDWLPPCFAGELGAPLVTTVHGFSVPGILPAWQIQVGLRLHLGCRSTTSGTSTSGWRPSSTGTASCPSVRRFAAARRVDDYLGVHGPVLAGQ